MKLRNLIPLLGEITTRESLKKLEEQGQLLPLLFGLTLIETFRLVNQALPSIGQSEAIDIARMLAFSLLFGVGYIYKVDLEITEDGINLPGDEESTE